MENWKEKYYTSLELLEDKEKEWSETDQLLRRCISRISLAADGQDRKLDEQLERLRNSVRRERNYDRIINMVDVIVETATDDNVKKMTGQDVIQRLVEKISFPEKLHKKQKEISKRLAFMKDESALGEIIEAFIALIESAIKIEVPETAKKEKKGLLGSIFSAAKTDQKPAQSKQVEKDLSIESKQPGIEDVIPLVRQVLLDLLMSLDVPVIVADELDRLRQKTRRIETKKDLQQLVQEVAGLISKGSTVAKADSSNTPDEESAININEILIQLLERFDLPEDLAERASELKQSWEKGLDEDHVVVALENIADLVIRMRTRIEHEKNDFQSFLKQVTEKLHMLDQHIQDNAEDQQAIFKENQQFSENVDGEVEKIQSDVDEAVDLANLKTSIALKLTRITEHVETFRNTEEKRKLQMEIRVGELASKVHQLETESQGLQEKLLEEQKNAMQDALTKLPNRLAWDQRMEYEFNRWQRYKSPLVVLVWDIDDFKKVNDTYGHKAGDKVLTTIATLLKDRVRETDFIARFGGEEFVMLLPETEVTQAQAVVEKLRAAVEACEFHHGDKRVPVTVSGGMTQFKKGDTAETAFERADQFLYKAKGSGKNRCYSELD